MPTTPPSDNPSFPRASTMALRLRPARSRPVGVSALIAPPGKQAMTRGLCRLIEMAATESMLQYDIAFHGGLPPKIKQLLAAFGHHLCRQLMSGSQAKIQGQPKLL